MSLSNGFVVPTSTQTTETFHAIRRTQEGLLYYTKINKDSATAIDVNGGNPSDVQLPTNENYVDASISYQSGATEYFTGNGSSTSFTLTIPVYDGSRIAVYLNGIFQELNVSYTYSSPIITFNIAPFNNSQIAVAKLDKKYFNNTTDFYQQYVFENGEATYFIDSNSYFVKRENTGKGLTSIAIDDFSTFESSSVVNSTTYSSAS
jgi:hypothetical protein